MLKAKDFKRYARESLSGRWLKAGAVGLVASFLGAAIRQSATASFNSSKAEEELSAMIPDGYVGMPEISAVFFAILMGVALVLLLWAIAVLVVGGATTLGYAKYNLNLVDDKEPQFGNLFSQYNRLRTGFGMQFFRGLFILLWSLLFVIPGIVASYSYAMTPFILCERPDMTAREAIAESKQLMKGNKWRLFCLDLSFIGWYIFAIIVLWAMMMISIVPMIIAGSSIDTTAMLFTGVIVGVTVTVIFFIGLNLVLMPYLNASYAVFYREISEGKYSAPQMEAEPADYIYETVADAQDIEYIEF